ncbi:MAG: DUF3626 domain-containing protein [Oryzihumus sp.]
MADTPAQARALDHVAALSSGPPVDGDLRVTLNFHPDRVPSGRPILVAWGEDGCYHAQFVTGTRNGGLTAHPGGDRWRWESRIFGGAYDGAHPAERPVYGALNLWRRPGGAAPRFGSAHVRLTAQVLARSTFCHPDSVFEPTHFGVARRAGLLARARPGEPELLDDYVEAQVHGPVRLDRDVEALVLDPCYRGTAVEAQARALPCPVEWHPGWRLTVAELQRHPDYRGPEVVEAGVAIARDGVLDGWVVGKAVAAGRYDPQTLKRVWHCVARFGSPAHAGERP